MPAGRAGWCTDSDDAEHTYEGLVRSLEYFGGAPDEVLVDNQKATVLLHPTPGEARFNERFLDLAGHYGFTPRACRPYRARTKGRDERMVGYIKHHVDSRQYSVHALPLHLAISQWHKVIPDEISPHCGIPPSRDILLP
jgi:transposase